MSKNTNPSQADYYAPDPTPKALAAAIAALRTRGPAMYHTPQWGGFHVVYASETGIHDRQFWNPHNLKGSRAAALAALASVKASAPSPNQHPTPAMPHRIAWYAAATPTA